MFIYEKMSNTVKRSFFAAMADLSIGYKMAFVLPYRNEWTLNATEIL
jgi:hypothetical protein